MAKKLSSPKKITMSSSPSPAKPEGSAPEVFGMVVELKEECLEEYKRLHANDNAGVRDLLIKYHLRRFAIFLQRMPDGKLYEFGTYSYTGTNREHDMALLNAEPRNKEWLKVCDPMQLGINGNNGWTMSELVYYNE
jgi:L-rhamnose mutarotase